MRRKNVLTFSVVRRSRSGGAGNMGCSAVSWHTPDRKYARRGKDVVENIPSARPGMGIQ